MKAILQEEDGKEIITKELQDILLQIYGNALTGLNKVMDTCGYSLNARSKPTLLHDFVMSEAKNHFEGLENVTITEKYNSMMVIIKKGSGSLAGRFKKLNKKGQTSNVQTKRNENIASNQLELEFEGMQRPTHIDIGYSPNETWTDFDAVKILCRVNNNPLWHIDLIKEDLTPVRSISLEGTSALEKAKDKKRVSAKKTGTNDKP